MIAITIADPREQELPNVGFIELRDAESGEILLLDTADSLARKEFGALNNRRRQEQAEVVCRWVLTKLWSIQINIM